MLVLGIVNALLQNWFWYWVLLRPFQNIGFGIGYCYSLNKILVMVLGISWDIGFQNCSGELEIRGIKRQNF